MLELAITRHEVVHLCQLLRRHTMRQRHLVVIPTKEESPAAGGIRGRRDQVPASPGDSSFLGMTEIAG